MCGFVGAFDLNSGSQPIAEGLKEELRAQVLEMSKRIRHRGPDWSGVYTGNNAILSHERLSIVDPLSGKQPLVSDDEKIILAANGEIYNHKEIRKQFVYLDYAPIAFVSAKQAKRIDTLLPLIDQVYENLNRHIKTNVLNEVILDAQLANPAKPHNGKKLKIYYASQVSTAPCTIVLFVNDPELMHFSYERYIENSLREAFD